MGFEIDLIKFQDRKWNFPNRKLNYFSHFEASFFIKRLSFGSRFLTSIFKTGNRPILTYLDPSRPILTDMDLSRPIFIIHTCISIN